MHCTLKEMEKEKQWLNMHLRLFLSAKTTLLFELHIKVCLKINQQAQELDAPNDNLIYTQYMFAPFTKSNIRVAFHLLLSFKPFAFKRFLILIYQN